MQTIKVKDLQPGMIFYKHGQLQYIAEILPGQGTITVLLLNVAGVDSQLPLMDVLLRHHEITIYGFYSPAPTKGEINDGYHTFNELYEHRIRLFITLCRFLKSRTLRKVWRTEPVDGWFILGTCVNFVPSTQITYHLAEKYYEECSFATDEVIPYDGHTSADVLERLKNL